MPICSLSKRSLLPSLTVFSNEKNEWNWPFYYSTPIVLLILLYYVQKVIKVSCNESDIVSKLQITITLLSVHARPMPEQCFSAKKKEPKEELEEKKVWLYNDY